MQSVPVVHHRNHTKAGLRSAQRNQIIRRDLDQLGAVGVNRIEHLHRRPMRDRSHSDASVQRVKEPHRLRIRHPRGQPARRNEHYLLHLPSTRHGRPSQPGEGRQAGGRCQPKGVSATQSFDAGQLLALEQLERRAAARGDVLEAARRSRAPACATAAALSPPPTTVKPELRPSRWRRRIVPAANGGFSKRPIGPFQKIVFAVATCAVKSATVFGPMSSAIVPVGNRADVDRGARVGVERSARRPRRRGRSNVHLLLARLLEDRARERRACPSSIARRLHVDALRGEERVRHRAADARARRRARAAPRPRRSCPRPSRRRAPRRTACPGS